jgi:hypothetical protein
VIFILKVRATLHYPGEYVPIDVHDAWSKGADSNDAVDLNDTGLPTYVGPPHSRRAAVSVKRKIPALKIAAIGFDFEHLGEDFSVWRDIIDYERENLTWEELFGDTDMFVEWAITEFARRDAVSAHHNFWVSANGGILAYLDQQSYVPEVSVCFLSLWKVTHSAWTDYNGEHDEQTDYECLGIIGKNGAVTPVAEEPSR